MRTKKLAKRRPGSELWSTKSDTFTDRDIFVDLPDDPTINDATFFDSSVACDSIRAPSIANETCYPTTSQNHSPMITEKEVGLSNHNIAEMLLPSDVTKFNRHQRSLLMRVKSKKTMKHDYRINTLKKQRERVIAHPLESTDTLIQTPSIQGILESSNKCLKRKKSARRSGDDPKTGRMLLECIPDISNQLDVCPNCPHCRAKKFAHESPNFCCSDGDISLVHHIVHPHLKELLFSRSPETVKFRTCIRTYNNHLAFTPFGVKYDKDLARMNKGIYTFRVQGQVYHFMDNLIENDRQSKNLQFYFFDTEYEIKNRLESCPRLSEEILKIILIVLEDNPYAIFFRSLRYQTELYNCKIILYANSDVDQRVYNTPTVSQVSALWVESEENGENSRRHIQVYTHGGESRIIEYYFGCYDPLQYPLLFPSGDLGWHQGIPKTGVK